MVSWGTGAKPRGRNHSPQREPAFWQDKRRAQGMVEFALAIPVLLILLFVVIEGGNFLFAYASATSASREAARFGAGIDNYTDCDAIRAAAKRVGFYARIDDADIIIRYDNGTVNYSMPASCSTPIPYANQCPAGGHYTGSVQYGDRIVVFIRGSYSPIVPIDLPSGYCIQSWNAHTIISEVPADR